jgi:cytochrome P450
MPVHHTTHDPSIWPDPDHFKGFRFYEKRLRNSKEDAEYQIAFLGANSLGFSYGRFACLRRLFAAAQLKLMLGLLISEYHFCFPKEPMPEILYVDDMILLERGWSCFVR